MKTKSLLLLAAPLAIAACAADTNSPLQPGATEHVALTLQAAGVQVYECRTAADAPQKHEWAFVAPEADLYNGSGQRVGRHFAGPTWESIDGSRVTASVVGRAPAASADSIPLLKLAARTESTQGAFAGVTTIQRLQTVGGSAPREGCSAATAGRQARVAYAAQYVFFKR